MSIGKRLLLLRTQSNQTQRELARSAAIAAPYLSRLEHDRIIPSVRTLSKIAAVLGVPLTAFFNGATTIEAADRCPVSLSGRCILDESYAGRTRLPNAGSAAYSGPQLEALKLCNLLLHKGDQEVSRRLLRTMKLLLAQVESHKAKGKKGGGV